MEPRICCIVEPALRRNCPLRRKRHVHGGQNRQRQIRPFFQFVMSDICAGEEGGNHRSTRPPCGRHPGLHTEVALNGRLRLDAAETEQPVGFNPAARWCRSGARLPRPVWWLRSNTLARELGDGVGWGCTGVCAAASAVNGIRRGCASDAKIRAPLRRGASLQDSTLWVANEGTRLRHGCAASVSCCAFIAADTKCAEAFAPWHSTHGQAAARRRATSIALRAGEVAISTRDPQHHRERDLSIAGLEPAHEGWKPSALPPELYPRTEQDGLNLFELPAPRKEDAAFARLAERVSRAAPIWNRRYAAALPWNRHLLALASAPYIQPQ